MERKSKYSVIGLMSGTSLDGLDMVFCEFSAFNDQWKFNIVAAETIAYSKEWFVKLTEAPLLEEVNLSELHLEYGKYVGEAVNTFVGENHLNPELICSHGHTVFHDPAHGMTFQLGSGKMISETSKKTVVSNFRALDVSLGGQGAPLVPVGDKLLFPDFDYCLNLGGFGNISFDENGESKSFDICAVNMALNEISRQLGLEYDWNGEIASAGVVDSTLLDKLNDLPYYSERYPKSLGREWYEGTFRPVIEAASSTAQDKLCTLCEHIAEQVANALNGSSHEDTLLITGGGAHNQFLIDQIKSKLNLDVHIPNNEIIDYKEALIFAFLGVLKVRDEINCLKSVTGAKRDCSGGEIHTFGG